MPQIPESLLHANPVVRRTREGDDFKAPRSTRKTVCRKQLRMPSNEAGSPPTIYTCNRPAGHQETSGAKNPAFDQHIETGRVRTKEGKVVEYEITWSDPHEGEVWRTESSELVRLDPGPSVEEIRLLMKRAERIDPDGE